MVRVSAYRLVRMAVVVCCVVILFRVRGHLSGKRANSTTYLTRNISMAHPSMKVSNPSPVRAITNPIVVPPTDTPTLVLLISYQRSGSTYVCHLFKDDSLLHTKEKENWDPLRTDLIGADRGPNGFNNHVTNVTDHVFFLYEPLDSLYTAMFGTQQGWNGADDIFNHDNGTQRALPPYEIKAVTWYLQKILQCHMAELPPGILLHKFWNAFRGSMPLTDQYSSCIINKTGLIVDWHLENEKCRKHIKKICGGYFGQKRYAQESICRSNLWGTYSEHVEYLPNAVKYAWGVNQKTGTAGLRPEFIKYFQCLSTFTRITRQCAEEYFDKPCRTASVRAVKTVRATMDSAKYLYDQQPNLKIIHSFRDPRALCNSRMRTGWAVNARGRRNMTYIATNYCTNVLRDSVILDNMANHRTHQVLYDDFVRHPTKHLYDVYRFMNRTIPASVTDEFKIKEHEKLKYIKRADRWRHELKEDGLAEVYKQCSNLITYMKNNHDRNFTG